MVYAFDKQPSNTLGPWGIQIGSSFQTPTTPHECWTFPFRVRTVCGGIGLHAKVTIQSSHNPLPKCENCQRLPPRLKITCQSGGWKKSVSHILKADEMDIETLFEQDIDGCLQPGMYTLHFELEDRNDHSLISASGVVRCLPAISHHHAHSS